MKNTMIKSLVTISFIVIIFVAVARILGKSETIADYEAKHQTVVPEIEVVEEADDSQIEMESEAENGSGDAAREDMQAENVQTDDIQNKDADTDIIGDLESEKQTETEEITVADSFYIEEISEELKQSMRGKSYADNIDETRVNFDMLRHVVILYNNFDGEVVPGEIVCNEAIAQDMLEIFEEFFEAGYQLEEVSLIDKYDGDDTVSMEHNNTSCFNYRVVDNSTKLSNHAYGRAIDVNPFYNPYITYKKDGTERVSPQGAEDYADRNAEFPYKIDENDLAYKLFKEHGFTWGGNWNSCKDYQHFEKKQ